MCRMEHYWKKSDIWEEEQDEVFNHCRFHGNQITKDDFLKKVPNQYTKNIQKRNNENELFFEEKYEGGSLYTSLISNESDEEKEIREMWYDDVVSEAIGEQNILNIKDEMNHNAFQYKELDCKLNKTVFPYPSIDYEVEVFENKTVEDCIKQILSDTTKYGRFQVRTGEMSELLCREEYKNGDLCR